MMYILMRTSSFWLEKYYVSGNTITINSVGGLIMMINESFFSVTRSASTTAENPVILKFHVAAWLWHSSLSSYRRYVGPAPRNEVRKINLV